MRLSELDYELPSELIAQHPLQTREASKLLVINAGQNDFNDLVFDQIPSLLEPSLFVFNDTRVFPARLFGRKESGGKVEVLLVRCVGELNGKERWSALCKSSKPLKPSTKIAIDGASMDATVVEKLQDGTVVLELDVEESVNDAIAKAGHVPLPPYIGRDAKEEDEARYQTVYAKHPGAVAAPTAGLHFSQALLEQLKTAGHTLAFVTLHVGPGTFRPVMTENLSDHAMHEELYEIPEAACTEIATAKAEGRRIVAVGTTVVRTLEGAAQGSSLIAGTGATSLFIKRGFEFSVVDDLITNFHLPKSTLLALVMAFGGVDTLKEAYAHAVNERYRFFSYGDAMLIKGKKP